MGKFSPYPSRSRKNYFAVPNRIYNYDLDATAIVIYCYLLFNQYGKWFPPLVDRKKLVDVLKLSDAIIEKRIRLLVSRKLIEVDEGYLFILKKRKNRPWNFWLKPKKEKSKNVTFCRTKCLHLTSLSARSPCMVSFCAVRTGRPISATQAIRPSVMPSA